MIAPQIPETRDPSFEFLWCKPARESPSLALKKESLTLGVGVSTRFLAAVASSDLPAGLIDGDLRGSVHLSLIGPGRPSNWTSDWTHLTLWRLENQENRRKPKKRANLRSLANWPKWRRRESNPNASPSKLVRGKQVTERGLSPSAHCQQSSDSECLRVSAFDRRLKVLIDRWPVLPEADRKKVEAICLEPPS